MLACPSPPAAMVRAVSSGEVGMSVLLLLVLWSAAEHVLYGGGFIHGGMKGGGGRDERRVYLESAERTR